MAYNFLENIPAYNKLQLRERKKYAAVIDAMNDDYMLVRSTASNLASQIGCQVVTVYLIARTIRRTLALYNNDEGVTQETIHRFKGRNDQECLKALSLWDKELSWSDVFKEEEEPEVEAIPMVPKADLDRLLDENRILRRHLEELKSLLSSLEKIMKGRSPEQAPTSSVPTSQTEEKAHEFAVLNQLPEEAIVNKVSIPIEYLPSFVVRFRKLDKLQQGNVRKALRNLAQLGYMATKGSQNHKKLPSGMTEAPKGAWVSRVNRKYRYVWGLLEDGGGGKKIVVYTTGNHSDIWKSEA